MGDELGQGLAAAALACGSGEDDRLLENVLLEGNGAVLWDLRGCEVGTIGPLGGAERVGRMHGGASSGLLLLKSLAEMQVTSMQCATQFKSMRNR